MVCVYVYFVIVVIVVCVATTIRSANNHSHVVDTARPMHKQHTTHIRSPASFFVFDFLFLFVPNVLTYCVVCGV